MTGIIKHFYANGNTALGFTSLFDSSLQEVERLYILKDGPIAVRSQLIQAVADDMAGDGYDIWLIHCPSDNDALDGLIVPAIKLGIIDGTGPRFTVPQLPGATLQYVNVGEASYSDNLSAHKQEIDRLTNQIAEAYERAYASFAKALRIHDDWEALYIDNMNFNAADELTMSYIHTLYGDSWLQKPSRVDRRFLGAATPLGAVDFVPNLTDGLKRYFVKGRAGSGKSTMLKKIASAAIERGLDVEIYHCGFDPNSLDMVIVRELGFAIFDSTAPHEYFPDRSDDEIVDMYISCIKPGTDELYSDSIADIKARYAAQMKQSIEHLAFAKSLQDEREQIYAQSTDLRQVEQIKEGIKQTIARNFA